MSANKQQAVPSRRQPLTGARARYEGSIRWLEGERLEQLFEGRRDGLRRNGRGRDLAVDAPEVTLSYQELDARGARMALSRSHPAQRVARLAGMAGPLCPDKVRNLVAERQGSRRRGDVGDGIDDVCYVICTPGVSSAPPHRS